MSKATDDCWASLKKAADALDMKAERTFGGDDISVEVLPGEWVTVNVWGYERPAYRGHFSHVGVRLVRLAKGRDVDVRGRDWARKLLEKCAKKLSEKSPEGSGE